MKSEYTVDDVKPGVFGLLWYDDRRTPVVGLVVEEKTPSGSIIRRWKQVTDDDVIKVAKKPDVYQQIKRPNGPRKGVYRSRTGRIGLGVLIKRALAANGTMTCIEITSWLQAHEATDTDHLSNLNNSVYQCLQLLMENGDVGSAKVKGRSRRYHLEYD